MGSEITKKDRIFNYAADIEHPAMRAAYLDDACGSDASLRAEIEELLLHDQEGGSFLESPPQRVNVTIDQPVAEAPGPIHKLTKQFLCHNSTSLINTIT